MKKHNELYQDLLALTNEEESPFVKADYEFEGRFLRVFDYVLASYSQFLKPSAIECRGIMFEIDDKENFLKLLSLPPSKFFNFNENPSVMKIDDYKVDLALVKEDGSLISSFMLNDIPFLKSKGSVCSPQAIVATELLHEDEELFERTVFCELNNYTVNFEYTAPENKIVLNYDKPELVVLNARCKTTGKFMPHEKLTEIFGDYVVKQDNTYKGMTLIDAVNDILPKDNMEGYVIFASKDNDSRIVKVKTDWYKNKHNLKDSCRADTKNGIKSLFITTLGGYIDDLRSDFIDDKASLESINLVEDKTVKTFNKMLNDSLHFLSENKDLSRKDFFVKLNSPELGVKDPYTKDFVSLCYIGKRLPEGMTAPVSDKNDLSVFLKKYMIEQAKDITENWKFNVTENREYSFKDGDQEKFKESKFKRIKLN